MAIPAAFRHFAAATLLATVALGIHAAGRPLETRERVPTPYYVDSVRIASDGERFFTVWAERRGLLGNALMGIFSDAAGRPLTDEPFVVLTGYAGGYDPIQLLATDDGFALFYTENYDESWFVRLDRAGRETSRRRLDLGSVYSLEAAWTGSQYVLIARGAFDDPMPVFFFDRDGNEVIEAELAAPSEDPLAMAPLGDRVIAFTTTTHALKARTVVSRSVSAPLVLDSGRAWSLVTTKTDEDGLLALWTVRSGDSWILKRAFVSNETSTLEAVELLRSDAQLTVAAAASNEDGFMVYLSDLEADERHDLAILQLDRDGRRVGEPRTVANAHTFFGQRWVVSAVGPRSLMVAFSPPGEINWVTTQTVAKDGTATTPRIVSRAFERHLAPVLGTTGSRVLAAVTAVAEADEVRGGYLDSEGAVSWGRLAPNRLAARELPWNGSEYLMLHWDTPRYDPTLLATRLSDLGVPLGNPILIGDVRMSEPEYEAAPAAVWVAERWVVMWPRMSTTFGLTTITRDGEASAIREIESPTSLPTPHHGRWFRGLAVTADARGMLAVWSEHHVPPCASVPCDFGPLFTFASRISTEGTFIGTPLKIFESRDYGEESSSLAAAMSGDELAVLASGTIAIVDTSTDELSLRAVETLRSRPTPGDLTWDGINYVAAMRYQRGDDWLLAFKRLDRRGIVVRETLEVTTLPPDSEFENRPSIVALAPGDTIVALQEGTFATSAGAVIYRERDLLPESADEPRRRAVRR